MARSLEIMVGAMALSLALGAGAGLGCEGDSDTVGGTSTGGSGTGTGSGTTGTGGTTTGGSGGSGGTGGAGAQGGTGGGGGLCGDPATMAQFEICRAADDETTCEAEGGTWTTIGLSPEPLCVCPTGQDGCACTRSTECVAPCIAPTSGGVMECDGVTEGECAEFAPFAGCWCWFDEDGQVSGMCID